MIDGQLKSRVTLWSGSMENELYKMKWVIVTVLRVIGVHFPIWKRQHYYNIKRASM